MTIQLRRVPIYHCDAGETKFTYGNWYKCEVGAIAVQGNGFAVDKELGLREIHLSENEGRIKSRHSLSLARIDDCDVGLSTQNTRQQKKNQ